jgi:hypothetical protein
MISSALAVVACLGISLLPVYLLRRRTYSRAREYFVASESTPFGVVRNSSISYSLQIPAFGLFFVWGAKGEFWPAILFSVMFAAGVYLIYRLRLPMRAFTSHALDHDGSVTVPGFLARQHGGNSRVQLFAAVVSVCALAGMIASGALAVASLMKPFAPGGVSTLLVACALMAAILLVAVPAGHSGVMRSAQIQLGIFYIALLTATLLVLYILLASVGRMPPRGSFAVAALAIFCVVIVLYRRSRYIDTSPLGLPLSADASAREPRGAGFFRRLSRVANEVIAILAGTTTVIALIALYSQGVGDVLAGWISAFWIEMPGSVSGLLALILLPAVYPVVDTATWLRMAALQADTNVSAAETGRTPETFVRVLGLYAGASSLLWLFICVLGTIAALATATPDNGDILRSFMKTLAELQIEVTDAAVWLLLASVVAMTILTGSAMFASISALLRYDIIANVLSISVKQAQPSDQARARRTAVIVSGGLCVFALIALSLLNGNAELSLSSGRFLHIQLACVCAQLAFAPLVLGPLIGGKQAAVGPAWASAIIAAGLVAGQGVIIVSLENGSEGWSWAAVPVCLAASASLYGLALLSTKGTSRGD